VNGDDGLICKAKLIFRSEVRTGKRKPPEAERDRGCPTRRDMQRRRERGSWRTPRKNRGLRGGRRSSFMKRCLGKKHWQIVDRWSFLYIRPIKAAGREGCREGGDRRVSPIPLSPLTLCASVARRREAFTGGRANGNAINGSPPANGVICRGRKIYRGSIVTSAPRRVAALIHPSSGICRGTETREKKGGKKRFRWNFVDSTG